MVHAREMEGLIGSFGAAMAGAAERSSLVRHANGEAETARQWSAYHAAKAAAAEANVLALRETNAVLLEEVDALSDECLALVEEVARLRAAAAQ